MMLYSIYSNLVIVVARSFVCVCSLVIDLLNEPTKDEMMNFQIR